MSRPSVAQRDDRVGGRVVGLAGRVLHLDQERVVARAPRVQHREHPQVAGRGGPDTGGAGLDGDRRRARGLVDEDPVTPRSATSSTASTRTVAGHRGGGPLAVAEARRRPRPRAGRASGSSRRAPATTQRDRDLGEQQPAVRRLDQAGPRARRSARRGRCPSAATARSSPPASVEKRASVWAAPAARVRPAPAGSGTSPTRPPSQTAPAVTWRTSAATSSGEGVKARECPTTDGPASARRAPPDEQPAGRPVRGSVGDGMHDDAQPHQHAARRPAARCRPHRGRRSVRTLVELEALAVDRRHRDLQDGAGGARPGGVRHQPAQPRADVGAGPGAGEDQGHEQREPRGQQQARRG